MSALTELTADDIFGPDADHHSRAEFSLNRGGFSNDVQILELPDPEYLIEGVLQRRGVGAIYAPPRRRETTLVASQVVALATKTDWLGHRVLQPSASVYVATEDPCGFKVRLRAAKRAAKIPLEQVIGVYTFPEPIDLRDPVSVGRFDNFSHKPRSHCRSNKLWWIPTLRRHPARMRTVTKTRRFRWLMHSVGATAWE